MFLLLLFCAACHAPTREARRMVDRAERLADTLPDSTARLIDSVLRMPVYFSERERMDMALLQAEALFGDHGNAISPVMDDDFFDEHTTLSTSPDLERAAEYFAKKKQYAKAAHAALYSGFVQQHYNEKEEAMRSFKEAEKTGIYASDSLTIALAQYRMGKLLYDDYLEDEALSILNTADIYFGTRWGERAFVQNLKAAAYIVLKQFDSANISLTKSLAYADLSHSSKAKRKALNNFAVFHRLQGNYVQSIECLKENAKEPDLGDSEKTLLNLNLGKSFASLGLTDSAAVYYQHIKESLTSPNLNENTKVSIYGALAQFAESQGDIALALQYRKTHEDILFDIQTCHEKKSVFRIRQQYDYESLRNTMNQKLIRKQHFITFISIFAIIGLTALAISQIQLAKTQKHKEREQAYEDLLKEKERQEQTTNEYGEKLSLSLKKEQSVKLLLHLFLENQGDEELLKKLEKSVFGKQKHIDAMMETVDVLYPKLREIVKQDNLGLDEIEQMDVIMSYFNISRQDEALLLHKTTDMVDKIRNRSRKKIQSAFSGNKLA